MVVEAAIAFCVKEFIGGTMEVAAGVVIAEAIKRLGDEESVALKQVCDGTKLELRERYGPGPVEELLKSRYFQQQGELLFRRLLAPQRDVDAVADVASIIERFELPVVGMARAERETRRREMAADFVAVFWKHLERQSSALPDIVQARFLADISDKLTRLGRGQTAGNTLLKAILAELRGERHPRPYTAYLEWVEKNFGFVRDPVIERYEGAILPLDEAYVDLSA